MGLRFSVAIYLTATIIMIIVCRFLIPFLVLKTGQEPVLFWFLCSGLLIFIPMIIVSIIILRKEKLSVNYQTWQNRLRFKRLTKSDLLWTLGGIAAVGLLSVVTMTVLEMCFENFDKNPSFMTFEPLSVTGKYWILWLWLPYWVVNIMGEEIFWRGTMQPRQEIVFGKYTWIIQGLGWAVFHIVMGFQLLLMLLPLVFIQPIIVQKTKNSWTGVIMHGLLNGPSFIAIALGLM
jgi:membrane protease YdiL (CAAX protease family)